MRRRPLRGEQRGQEPGGEHARHLEASREGNQLGGFHRGRLLRGANRVARRRGRGARRHPRADPKLSRARQRRRERPAARFGPAAEPDGVARRARRGRCAGCEGGGVADGTPLPVVVDELEVRRGYVAVSGELVDVPIVVHVVFLLVVLVFLLVVLIRLVRSLVPGHEASPAGHQRDDLANRIVMNVPHAVADLQAVVRRLERSHRGGLGDVIRLLLRAIRRNVRREQVRQRLLRRLQQERHRGGRRARAIHRARSGQNLRVRQEVQDALLEAQMRHAGGVGREEPQHEPRRRVHHGGRRGRRGRRGVAARLVPPPGPSRGLLRRDSPPERLRQ